MSIIIEIIYPQIENGNAPDLTKSVFHLFVGISIAPLLETFAFQMLPICIINRFISKNIWTQILPSAILFGSMHYYSLAYVIVTFFIGIVFALGFYIYQRKLNIKRAFWYIVLLHALHNALALSLTLLPE